MKYRKKDLRAVDMFALILIGIGGLLALTGAIQWFNEPSPPAAPLIADPESFNPKDKTVAKGRGGSPMRTVLLGGVFIILGTALNLGLRRVIANDGEDPPDPLSTD